MSFINDQEAFKKAMSEDKMATDKLREGIEGFTKDGQTLKDLLNEKLAA